MEKTVVTPNLSIQGNLTQKDAILKREEWKEMARMMGMPGVKYQYIIPGTEHYTSHAELRGTYSELVDIPMLWIEVPDEETANNLGWLSVLENDKPYLAQLPYDTPHLKIGCRLSIPFVGDSQVEGEDGEPEIFRITRTYVNSRFPNCRMVQLAPEFSSYLIADKVDTPEAKIGRAHV